MTALGAAALRLAESGCHVIPIKPRAKTPITQHGVADASRDAVLIGSWWRQWPTANVAVACGPSGVAVIDLDGPAGIAHWRRLVAEHPTPQTLTSRTGTGWHLWFLAPAGRLLGNTASKIAPKIDSRGHGGFVVAPPSIHPSGSRYEWSDRQPDAMAELPGWIADALDPPPGRLDARPPSVVGTGYAAAALRSAVERVATAVPGCRNSTLNMEVYSLARLVSDGVLDPGEAVAALLGAAAVAGLPEREAARTITSALRARIGAAA